MRPLYSITVAAAFAIALAACSDSNDDEEPAPEDEVSVPAEEAPAEEPAGAVEEQPADAEPAAEEAPAEDQPAAEAPAAAPPGEEGGVGALAPEEEPAVVADEGLEDTLYMELECGRVVIETRPDLAPLHVAQIKTLTRDGFYDGLTFHRVIDGFMAQTGDPNGDGSGGSSLPDIPAEFTDEPFDRGTVGMARFSNDVNSANSQFFIMFAREPLLDGDYTVWGDVTEGMDCVDQIARGQPPADPDVILSMNVAADVQ